MRVPIFALAALLMAGCSSVPTQPAKADAQAFQTQFLNLASITDQLGNQINVNPNTQVNVSPQVAPVTQVQAMSFGSTMNAAPQLNNVTNQSMNPNISQWFHQFAASV